MAGMNTPVDLSENIGIGVNVIGWVSTGIATFTVFLKVLARTHVGKSLGWDDFFIFFSLACSIIAAALVSYSVTLGLGRHTAAVLADHGPERLVMTAKWQILGYPFNIGSFSFPNISIAILINDLLVLTPLRSRLLYAMSWFQVLLALVSVFVIFLQCSPTARLWDASLPGTCWNPVVFNDFSYFVSAYTTLTDLVLAIVPISAFWKLQMHLSTKLGICTMMGLTLLSAVVTVVKATYLHLFTDRTDPLFNVVPLVIWGLIEQNVVIVAACIPTLRPSFFFRKAFGSKISNSNTGSSRARSGSAFKLSNHLHSGSRRLPSQTELALEEIQKVEDPESNSSKQGIMRTREVRVESSHGMHLEACVDRKTRVVPANLKLTELWL